jgi:hypothetical protein
MQLIMDDKEIRTPEQVKQFVDSSQGIEFCGLNVKGLFDDAILGNSAQDRLTNASYQIVIEGSSYREKLSPHRRNEALITVK